MSSTDAPTDFRTVFANILSQAESNLASAHIIVDVDSENAASVGMVGSTGTVSWEYVESMASLIASTIGSPPSELNPRRGCIIIGVPILVESHKSYLRSVETQALTDFLWSQR